MNPTNIGDMDGARVTAVTGKQSLTQRSFASSFWFKSFEFSCVIILLSTGFFAMTLSWAGTPKADLIFLKAHIWTGIPSAPFAEAIAIQGDKILAVGSNEEILVLKGDQTKIQPLRGELLMPGFNDDHTHFLEGGFRLMSVDLRDAASEGEFARRIARKAHELAPGRWITGGSWDHESWPGAPLPAKELIDSLTPQHPVFVQRLDGHMGLANSLALKLAGINASTPVPAGGEIVKNPKTGQPTGILKDSAMSLVEQIIPAPSREEEDKALSLALREAARLGVTSVQDVTPWESWEVFRRARQANQLTVRIYSRTPLAQWQKQADWVREHGVGDGWLKLGGLKAFMDGSLGSTTAYFFKPYTDAPNTSGLLADDLVSSETFQNQLRLSDQAGLQLSIHAIGDKANHLLLNFYEAMEKQNGPRDRRPRIEHAQHLVPEDVPRFARLGVIASMQPAHAADDGRWAEKRLGPQRAKNSYVFRSLLKNQAMLCFGTDWPVAPLAPMLGVYAAVTRRTLDGKHPSGWIPEEKITLDEALRCYTLNSAFAAFEEKIKGTLEPGKLADLVVLDRDLFQTPPEKIREASVLFTIVNGKIVYPAPAKRMGTN